MSRLLAPLVRSQISSVANHPCYRGLRGAKGRAFSVEGCAKDWNANEDFFRFTRGRFVCDEASHMARRHVRFDMNELARISAKAVGAARCVGVEKCPEGMCNKSFVFTMNDGRQCIGKVPNPNAGLPHFTTASEVATMDFVRNVLGTPAPKVYAWSSRAQSNPVGAEFIIMEKVPGLQLREIWGSMTPSDKGEIVMTIFRYQRAWSSATFAQFGSLYYAEDVETRHLQQYIYTDRDGRQVKDSRFAIGPATGRDWFDEGREALQCDRGPWNSVAEYRKAIGHREIAAIQTSPRLAKQMVMVCGPGLHQPMPRKKLAALQSYLTLVDFLIPPEAPFTSSHIWHDDLHGLTPLFDHQLDPGFLEYDGPELENLERPQFPENFKDLDKTEKAHATDVYTTMSVLVVYRRLAQRKNPLLYRNIQFKTSESFHLLNLARRLLEVGEAHFNAMLVDLQETWSDLPAVRAAGNPPFPLIFSKTQLAEIDADVEAATHGIEMMQGFKSRLGDLWSDRYDVRHEHYHETKKLLRQLKDEVAREFVRSDEDKALLGQYWPFD